MPVIYVFPDLQGALKHKAEGPRTARRSL